MKEIDNEVLTNYIFDLLEDSQKKQVKKAINEQIEVAQKYKKLRMKFSQLNLIEDSLAENKPKQKLKLFYTLAAILILSFCSIGLLNSNSTPSEKHYSYLTENTSTLFTDNEIDSSYTTERLLLSDVDEPIIDDLKFDIPTVEILYDNEDYEIVDLQIYGTLKLPAQNSSNIINPNLILISNIH